MLSNTNSRGASKPDVTACALSPDSPSVKIPLPKVFVFWTRREVVLGWLPCDGAVPDAICPLLS